MFNKRIKAWLVVLLIGLTTTLSQPLMAEDGHRGTVRSLDANARHIAIDAGVFPLSKNVTIKNLAGGWSGLSALRKDTPIIFKVDSRGTVTEIVILPENEQEQRELGFGPDTNQ